MQLLTITLILLMTFFERANQTEDDQDNDQAWLDLIPEEDREQFDIAASDVPLSDHLSGAGVPPYFQEDLKTGCDAASIPQCRPAAGADAWKLNKKAKTYIILYDVSSNIPEKLRNFIITTLETVDPKEMCILFQRPEDDSSQSEDRRIVFRNKQKCAVDWGSETKSKLEIWLNDDCIDNKVGNLFHFVLHALGFPKEHVRHDRDDYIVIYRENILEDREIEFRKDPDSVTYDDPYDYASILHPSYKFLTKSGKATITGNTKVRLGLRDDFSKYDALKIKRKFCTGFRHTPKIIEPYISPTCPEPKTVTVFRQAPVVTSTVIKTLLPQTCLNAKGFEEAEEKVSPQLILQPLHIETISPTPTKRCPDGLFTSRNIQIMSRTTVYSAYPFTTLWENKSRSYKRSFLPPEKDENNDWLQDGSVYAEFAGKIVNVKTTIVDDATRIFRTSYEGSLLADGASYFQQKAETRVLQC